MSDGRHQGTRGGQDEATSLPVARPGYGRLGVVAAGVVALALLFQFPAHALERRLGVLPVSEPFTELYFAHPTDLPARAGAGRLVSLPFVLDNREGRSYLYRWSVVAVAGTRRRLLERGSARVANGRSTLVPLEISGGRLSGSSTVEIRLERPTQSIDVHLADR